MFQKVLCYDVFLLENPLIELFKKQFYAVFIHNFTNIRTKVQIKSVPLLLN